MIHTTPGEDCSLSSLMGVTDPLRNESPAMIKRITIDDTMAHQHTVLELGPGLTVLAGPNNVGKSAVVEAIRSVAQNPAPEHVVRHGARQALVRVELDSGEVIE